MKIQQYISLFLLALLFACTEGELIEDVENPAWVAEKFYEAFAEKDFERAAYYCDKPSKTTLESYSYVASYMPDQKFESVDSCELYQEHAYCYCKYKDEDSVSQTEKLLLRNYGKIWKVHFTKGGFGSADESVLYDTKPELHEEAPENIFPLIKEEKTDLDSVLSSAFRFMDDVDVVIPFFNESNIGDKDELATKEYSYDNYYVRRDYLQTASVVFKYYFTEEVLTNYEIIISDIESRNTFATYQYLLEKIEDYYGAPYNTEKIAKEDWFRYKEIKWFLKGYNEELIVSVDTYNVTVILQEAY